MEVAALIVSLVALGFAGGSWWASRRSASAAEESAREAAAVARIEKERRHDERTPAWEISGKETADELIEFRLTVSGPANSYGVKVEVKPESVVRAVRREQGGRTSLQTLDLGVVSRGVDAVFYGDGTRSSETMRVVVHFEEPDGSAWSPYREFKVIWKPRMWSM